MEAVAFPTQVPALVSDRRSIYSFIKDSGSSGLPETQLWEKIEELPSEHFDPTAGLTARWLIETLRYEGPLRIKYDEYGEAVYIAA